MGEILGRSRMKRIYEIQLDCRNKAFRFSLNEKKVRENIVHARNQKWYNADKQ